MQDLAEGQVYQSGATRIVIGDIVDSTVQCFISNSWNVGTPFTFNVDYLVNYLDTDDYDLLSETAVRKGEE